MLQPPLMGRIHGVFNVVGGLWPLLHLRSFEAVFGPKEDRWLVYTVAGLLTSVGYAQARAGTAQAWPHARRLGVATATTLLGIDLVYVSRGRLRWTYLVDAIAEAALLVGWAVATHGRPHRGARPGGTLAPAGPR
jgi:hypothetical protein